MRSHGIARSEDCDEPQRPERARARVRLPSRRARHYLVGLPVHATGWIRSRQTGKPSSKDAYDDVRRTCAGALRA